MTVLSNIEMARETFSRQVASLAVQSLIQEAELTPKPGLVDQKDSGAHTDMNIDMMIESANTLYFTFFKIAKLSFKKSPSKNLRETIARIGREGEGEMYKVTGGINTHKGAIWAIGLLTAAASMHYPKFNTLQIAQTAGRLASIKDVYNKETNTNGIYVKQKYRVKGAKEEAQDSFPHVIKVSLPVLRYSRESGLSENHARLTSLLSLIVTLNDTCILYRGGTDSLISAKEKAQNVLENGGVSTDKGWKLLNHLNKYFISQNISPGGSADLLSATLFLDFLENH